jgi:hypothetical protein
MTPLDEVKREVGVHALDANWKAAIDEASSEPELLDLARQFIDKSSRFELERIPTACRPKRVTSAGDLSLITFRLRRAFCSASIDSGTAACIERALAFFEALCDRLFDLRVALPSFH